MQSFIFWRKCSYIYFLIFLSYDLHSRISAFYYYISRDCLSCCYIWWGTVVNLKGFVPYAKIREARIYTRTWGDRKSDTSWFGDTYSSRHHKNGNHRTNSRKCNKSWNHCSDTNLSLYLSWSRDWKQVSLAKGKSKCKKREVRFTSPRQKYSKSTVLALLHWDENMETPHRLREVLPQIPQKVYLSRENEVQS